MVYDFTMIMILIVPYVLMMGFYRITAGTEIFTLFLIYILPLCFKHERDLTLQYTFSQTDLLRQQRDKRLLCLAGKGGQQSSGHTRDAVTSFFFNQSQ